MPTASSSAAFKVISERRSVSSSGGNSPDHDPDEDDGELNINLEGLNDCTCCVCSSFNQENGNKLMECHNCQNLYHQECHVPPVSNEEANDPRLVWNCSGCTKSNVSLASLLVDSQSQNSTVRLLFLHLRSVKITHQ